MSAGAMVKSPAEAIRDKATTEEEALVRLDDAATQFQRDGRYLDALECMERGLILRHRMYGGRSAEVLAACKAAGELCNLLAMTYLQRGETLKLQQFQPERNDGDSTLS
jgi:hypothetical protein